VCACVCVCVCVCVVCVCVRVVLPDKWAELKKEILGILDEVPSKVAQLLKVNLVFLFLFLCFLFIHQTKYPPDKYGLDRLRFLQAEEGESQVQKEARLRWQKEVFRFLFLYLGFFFIHQTNR
jgi:hypothetical protein